MARVHLTSSHPLVQALEIRGLPAFFFFSGGHLATDIGRSFYLRSGVPIHNMLPQELSAELQNAVLPVGVALKTEKELHEFLNDTDDADGELPPVQLVLRWPSEQDPAAQKLSAFLKQWSLIFRVAVVLPQVMTAGLSKLAAPSNSA